VWEIGDTANSFYSVADVMFSGGGTPPPVTWVQQGSITPSVDLIANDRVSTRVFDASGERRELTTSVTIANNSDGQRNTCSYWLATRINTEQTLLAAGPLGSDGNAHPVYGLNPVYVRSNSGLTRVEIQIDKAAPPPGADLTISGLQSSYVFTNGQLSIDFNVTVVGNQDVSVSVYDANGVTRGFVATSLADSTAALRINLTNLTSGRHQLVAKGVVRGTGQIVQKTVDLTLSSNNTGSYDYLFPNSLSRYRAGTTVLQTKTGLVYQCKPWP